MLVGLNFVGDLMKFGYFIVNVFWFRYRTNLHNSLFVESYKSSWTLLLPYRLFTTRGSIKEKKMRKMSRRNQTMFRTRKLQKKK